jgi:NADH-quinone oxidoreductase subunit A
MAVLYGDSSTMFVIGLLMFMVAGFAICAGGLLAGRLVRPKMPHPEKAAIYECGEPTIGEGWVQFDLRFYVVALLFIIFDVEIALFWPWAVVYGSGDQQVKTAALYDMLFFFGVLVVGFLYLWRYGYLDWVRAAPEERREPSLETEVSL